MIDFQTFYTILLTNTAIMLAWFAGFMVMFFIVALYSFLYERKLLDKYRKKYGFDREIETSRDFAKYEQRVQKEANKK